MGDAQRDGNRDTTAHQGLPSSSVSQCIDWYAEGEERIVEADGIQVVVRFVGRKGRRGRIAITAPPGAAFRTRDRNKTVQSPDRSM
ncbi:MAG: hypothetical protein KKA28_02880 [Planctomycetes bacterium]|nr:hypothetical protein [Planctomycetota bacterium]MCG2684804.1 hypothetical protein [Planctomycetales bacterium]